LLKIIGIFSKTLVKQPRYEAIYIYVYHIYHIYSSEIITNATYIFQEITKRAVAESGIRQALIDLEVWESTASLPLQESTDSKNMMILLVGDYGSLLAKIGLYLLLLTV